MSSKVFPRYEPLRRTLLCAMGHNGEFGCALWATADLVMGHCGGFGYALWATARNEAVQYKSVLFLHYGPQRRIWLCAMGHGAGFGYPPWAVAKDLFKGYKP